MESLEQQIDEKMFGLAIEIFREKSPSSSVAGIAAPSYHNAFLAPEKKLRRRSPENDEK